MNEVARMPKVLQKRAAFVALWKAFRAGNKPGTPGIADRLKAVPRMLFARVRGRYTELSWGRLGLMAGAVGYVVSPIDLLPEAFLLLPGLLDDTVVVAWIAGSLLDETERFITWERGGKAPPASARSGRLGDDVIDGEVVS
jgi:uncharacterized membrane protein YkvA (DUF1232 family)